MFSIDLVVKTADDPDTVHKVTVGDADIVRFEQHFGLGILEVLGPDTPPTRTEHLAFLAWSALSRRDRRVDKPDECRWGATFDDFVTEHLGDVDYPIDPTTKDGAAPLGDPTGDTAGPPAPAA